MTTRETGISVCIKQVMVLGIRLAPNLPLGPRGGVVCVVANEGPDVEWVGPPIPAEAGPEA